MTEKITDHPDFHKILEQAVYCLDEILCGVEESEMDTTQVSVSAAFLADLTDLLIEFACVYEEFKAEEHLHLLDLCRTHQTDRFTGDMTKQ